VVSRLVLAGLAVVAVAVGVFALRADHRCSEVTDRATSAPPGELARVADATAARCGDPRDSAVLTLVLTSRGQRGTALELARRMTRAHPDDYLGWLVVWRLSREPGALARARALNPRGTPAPR
jgi:hypothetical protein